jgi:hypothetical protein
MTINKVDFRTRNLPNIEKKGKFNSDKNDNSLKDKKICDNF